MHALPIPPPTRSICRHSLSLPPSVGYACNPYPSPPPPPKHMHALTTPPASQICMHPHPVPLLTSCVPPPTYTPSHTGSASPPPSHHPATVTRRGTLLAGPPLPSLLPPHNPIPMDLDLGTPNRCNGRLGEAAAIAGGSSRSKEVERKGKPNPASDPGGHVLQLAGDKPGWQGTRVARTWGGGGCAVCAGGRKK